MRITAVVSSLFVVGFMLPVNSADPPKSSVKLIVAQAEFEKSLDKLKSTQDEAIKLAALAYRKQLVEILDEETKASHLESAIAIRDEIRRVDDGGLSRKITTKDDLAKAIVGTTWDWKEAPLEFKAGGAIGMRAWEDSKPSQTTRWEVIDRRTVILVIVRGRESNRVAVLSFTESLDSFRVIDFDSTAFGPVKRFKR